MTGPTTRTVLAVLAAGLALTGVTAAPASAAPAEPPAGTRPAADAAPQRDPDGAKKNFDDKARRGQIPDNIASYGIDASTGQVVMAVVGKRNEKSAAFVSGADPDDVRFVEDSPKHRPVEALVGGDPITASNGGRCSIGFSARRGDTTVVITAGHCTEIGGTWSGRTSEPIGPVSSSSFPVDDFGTIDVTNTAAWQGSAQVRGTTSVIGAVEAPVGAETCRSGSTTGYRCGTIEGKDQTVNYGGGDVVFGLTRTSACAEPGDSGGSYVAGRQAQGMTSGGSGDCSTGGTTFFQPVDEALAATGATLVTD